MEHYQRLVLSHHQSQVQWPPPLTGKLRQAVGLFERLDSSSTKRCANETVLQQSCRAQQHHCLAPPPPPPHDAADVKTTDAPDTATTTTEQCQTLWFSGFHEGPTSRCSARGIRMEYAAALASANQFAAGVLQPVLLLGRLGLDADQDVSGLREWARRQGAIVVTIDRLSMQEKIIKWHQDDTSIGSEHLMGPYLRMDIPWIIEKYKLFDMRGVCKNHVLYTDSDSLFVNPINHADIALLKNHLQNRIFSSTVPQWTRWWKRFLASEPPYLLYGREGQIDGRTPRNTGVMLIDVPRFREELPSIIRFRDEHPNPSLFQAFDQGLLNRYFERSQLLELGRHMLPIFWNWKIYWQLEPASLHDLKVVHFHGPKPTLGAQSIARCELDLGPHTPQQYRGMIERGICCDRGATAHAVLQLFNDIRPDESEVC